MNFFKGIKFLKAATVKYRELFLTLRKALVGAIGTLKNTVPEMLNVFNVPKLIFS